MHQTRRHLVFSPTPKGAFPQNRNTKPKGAVSPAQWAELLLGPETGEGQVVAPTAMIEVGILKTPRTPRTPKHKQAKHKRSAWNVRSVISGGSFWGVG